MSTNITPLFKIHATYDISSIHLRKPNVYSYKNQTRDQQKIPANFKSTIQKTSDGQQDKSYRFYLEEREGIEKEDEYLFRVKEKNKSD